MGLVQKIKKKRFTIKKSFNKRKKIYHYFVTIPKNYLEVITNNKTIKIFELKIEENYFSFYTNNINNICNINNVYNQELSECIKIDNLIREKGKKYIVGNIITVVGVLFMIFMLFVINKTITEIKFTNDDYYSEEVYDYVNSKLQHFDFPGPLSFAFLSKDLNDINKELRSTFYKYQWIGIKKEGTILYIDIAKTTDINEPDNVNTNPGGLYSKYNALIKGYYIIKGKSLIKKDTTVKAGDELISGVLELYDNSLEYVRADGYVIGEVTEYKEVKVLKSDSSVSRTGNLEIINIYILFGKVIGKINPQFENYDTEYETVYKLGNILEIQKVYCYELKENKTIYTIDEAIEYGKSIIENNFLSVKEYKNEKINSLEYLSYKEDENYYYLKYIINFDINICEFIEYK